LYILSLLFGITSNLLIFYIGLSNYRLIVKSQVTIVKIERKLAKIKKLEFM